MNTQKPCLFGAISWYSLMDGVRSPYDVLARAAEGGWGAVALTDTNNLYGLPDFIDAAATVGIKAIAGARLRWKDLCLRAYCMNHLGYARLCTIISAIIASKTNTQYSLLQDLCTEGWDGLVLSTNEPTLLCRLVGRGRLYGALVLGNPQHTVVQMCQELGLGLLAEHHCRFLTPSDKDNWYLLRAVEERTSYEKAKQSGWGIRGESVMLSVPKLQSLAFLPSALKAAIDLAQEAPDAVSFFSSTPIFPPYKGMPEDEVHRLLHFHCEEGIRRRYGVNVQSQILSRLSRELKIISDKNFSSYFMVVRDIVLKCPRTCGRGSAASSLVSYLLGLTHVDPIKYDLFFERFLNEGRQDYPDIDIDFPWDERGAILESVFADYPGCAAMVADHCRFSHRSALREAAIALGFTVQEKSEAARALRLGRFESLPAELQRCARMLYGSPHYIGTHPGGVVITPKPITTYTHVQTSPAGYPVLAWEKQGTERAGLVKIDILGNRSLAVLRDCLTVLHSNRSPKEINTPTSHTHHMQNNDEWIFGEADKDQMTRELIKSGKTMGIFYIESPATRQLLLKMDSIDYERLVIISSIIRPAANKWIQEYVRRVRGEGWRKLHPGIEVPLQDTMGVMVYQEDVSRVAISAAGFSSAEADRLRKVITKTNDTKNLDYFKQKFFEGCTSKGVGFQDSEIAWNMMLSFREYSFCKAHSASYALLSFRLAWVKAHYPGLFMASVINNKGGFYCTQAYLGEARRLGIQIVTPHVNMSEVQYSFTHESLDNTIRFATTGSIRVGLLQVSGLSTTCAHRIVSQRMLAGIYVSLEDFYLRIRPNEAELCCLVKTGCLDGLPDRSFGQKNLHPFVYTVGTYNRPRALWMLYYHRGQVHKGYDSITKLFKDEWEVPSTIVDYTEEKKLKDEVYFLGLIISRPPASIFTLRARRLVTQKLLPPLCSSSAVATRVGIRLSVFGVCISGKEVLSQHKKPMAFYTLEDETGLIEIVFFPDSYEVILPILEDNFCILCVGTVTKEYDALILQVDEAYGLNTIHEDTGSRMLLQVYEHSNNQEMAP